MYVENQSTEKCNGRMFKMEEKNYVQLRTSVLFTLVLRYLEDLLEVGSRILFLSTQFHSELLRKEKNNKK